MRLTLSSSSTGFLALSLVFAVAEAASTIGNAIVHNNCSETVYLWSVDSVQGPAQTIPTGHNYTEQYHYDSQSGGVTLKVVTSPGGLTNGSPQTDFAYTFQTATSQIWYDMSDVFGDPFNGDRLVVSASDLSCPVIDWENGTPPSGSQVKVCESSASITLTLCAA